MKIIVTGRDGKQILEAIIEDECFWRIGEQERVLYVDTKDDRWGIPLEVIKTFWVFDD